MAAIRIPAALKALIIAGSGPSPTGRVRQAAAADETARVRADHRSALEQLTTATSARITALEETRDAHRARADRAEADLDAACTENRRLAQQIAQAAEAEPDADGTPGTTPRPGNPR
jgi:siroheme synthase (precorrin-2 oxidase/ferrochelatase)